MDFWSWPLSAVGLFGYYLLAEKHSRWGWFLQVVYNVCWIIYAVTFHMWGFVVVSIFFGLAAARGYQKWEKK